MDHSTGIADSIRDDIVDLFKGKLTTSSGIAIFLDGAGEALVVPRDHARGDEIAYVEDVLDLGLEETVSQALKQIVHKALYVESRIRDRGILELIAP